MVDHCKSCHAECCYDVNMHYTDIRRLQKQSPKEIPEGKIKRLLGEQYLVVGRCPWLAGGRCLVYDSRPSGCKSIGSEFRPCHKMAGGPKGIYKLYEDLKDGS